MASKKQLQEQIDRERKEARREIARLSHELEVTQLQRENLGGAAADLGRLLKAEQARGTEERSTEERSTEGTAHWKRLARAKVADLKAVQVYTSQLEGKVRKLQATALGSESREDDLRKRLKETTSRSDSIESKLLEMRHGPRDWEAGDPVPLGFVSYMRVDPLEEVLARPDSDVFKPVEKTCMTKHGKSFKVMRPGRPVHRRHEPEAMTIEIRRKAYRRAVELNRVPLVPTPEHVASVMQARSDQLQGLLLDYDPSIDKDKDRIGGVPMVETTATPDSIKEDCRACLGEGLNSQGKPCRICCPGTTATPDPKSKAQIAYDRQKANYEALDVPNTYDGEGFETIHGVDPALKEAALRAGPIQITPMVPAPLLARAKRQALRANCRVGLILSGTLLSWLVFAAYVYSQAVL